MRPLVNAGCRMNVRGTLLIAVFFAAAIAPLVALKLSNSQEAADFTTALGRNVGLLGYSLLCLQFVLAARWSWVEGPFGLDILLLFHRAMGIFAAGLLLAHPTLLALDEGFDLLFGASPPAFVWLGRAAILLLMVHVVLALNRRRIGLSFESWRLLHDLAAAAVVILVTLHVWWSEHPSTPAVRGTMTVLFVIALIALAWQRLPQALHPTRRLFRVGRVTREARGIWTLEMQPVKPGETTYLPGQFHFVRLLRGRGLADEEHHFTIASSPAGPPRLLSTVKEVGDYTRTIGRTEVGDLAICEGAFGRFSYVLFPMEKDLVFIAAGIGITPFMSMLRHMRDTGSQRAVLLLFGNRTEQDIPFRQELDDMVSEQRPRLQVFHFVGSPGPDWDGEAGRIDEQAVTRFCSDHLHSRGFWVCGPRPMTDSILDILHRLGVEDTRLHTEVFAVDDARIPATAKGRRLRTTILILSLSLIVVVVAAAIGRAQGEPAGSHGGQHKHGALKESVDEIVQNQGEIA